MKTVVLDDDPTGTQSASGVTVLLEYDAVLIRAALGSADSVFIQTNSRALDEAAAVALVARVRDASLRAAEALGEHVQFVLRGDSTLRGHVFAETEQFVDDDAVIVFNPAFPAGGRTTVDGVHLVRIGDRVVPAHETEYADDPVFPFSSGVLADYVAEKSGRPSVNAGLELVRSGGFAAVLREVPGGTVVLPDAETDADIDLLAEGITRARADGRSVVVRSAAPLAAALADVRSAGLLPTPLIPAPVPTLLACGSHTAGATAQLAAAEAIHGPAVVIPTSEALLDPEATGHAAAELLRARLREGGLALVTTERHRRAEHNTLDHGERVMRALSTAVNDVIADVDVLISKGGITSAELARVGVGASRAGVRGQVLPGVSVWDLVAPDGHSVLYIVVPGNVGGPEALVDTLAAVRR